MFEHMLKNAYIGEYNTPPSEYQKVEYIQSSWTQRIDSWITLSNNLWFNVDFMELDAINWNWHCVLGGRYRAWQEEVCINTYYYYSNWIFAFGTQNVNPYITPNTRQQCSMKNRLFTACNWNTNTFNSGTFRSWLPLYIFAMRDISGSSISDYSNARLYNLKLYDGDTLVRDFVPCYRKSDNVIWLYDLVNYQFYTNSWTWTFTKWPDVN